MPSTNRENPMNFKYLTAFCAASAVASLAFAQDPNIQPGMWETSTTFAIKSEQFSMPPQTNSDEECITEERIREGFTLLEDNEDCEVTERDLRSDGMNYTLVCPNSGGTMTMEFDMAFNGDSTSGTIDGRFESQMGVMQISGDVSGRRIGDCTD
jgi:hypothetical protein